MTSEIRNKRFKWTVEQEQMIRELYPTLGPKKLAAQMGVTLNALQGKAKCMGVKLAGRVQWTKEMVQTLKDRYAIDGPKKLAEELGVPYWALLAKARRNGAEPTREAYPQPIWTPEMEARIKEQYPLVGAEPLAKEFGLSVSTIRHRANALGTTTNAGHARWGKERSETRANLNIRYFDAWTPNMAYILGFTFADGNINKKKTAVRYLLSRKDECVLDFIRKELGSDLKLYYNQSTTRGKQHPNVRLVVSSTVIVQRLMELGVKPAKTYRDDPFPDIPDEMVPHFLRGLLDGDGSVAIGKNGACSVSWLATEQFLTGVRDRLVRFAGLTELPIRMRQGVTARWGTVVWTAVDDLKKIKDYIYADESLFCLERKRSRLFGWLSVPRKTIKRRRSWEAWEEQSLIELYPQASLSQLAKALDRRPAVLVRKIKELGITKKPTKENLN